MFWSCIDVIVVRVKVSRGIEPFSPMGIESADTIVSHPKMGRFVLTNHIYFRITQPGSISVQTTERLRFLGEKKEKTL